MRLGKRSFSIAYTITTNNYNSYHFPEGKLWVKPCADHLSTYLYTSSQQSYEENIIESLYQWVLQFILDLEVDWHKTKPCGVYLCCLPKFSDDLFLHHSTSSLFSSLLLPSLHSLSHTSSVHSEEEPIYNSLGFPVSS